MPVFPVTAVDRLIEPFVASSSLRSPPMETESLSSTDRKVPFSFYPLLYITPPQQRPPSPTAFSPSPYVLNYKRRNPVQNGVAGTEATVGTGSNGVQQNIVSQSSANVCEKLKIRMLSENSQENLNVNLVDEESSDVVSGGEICFGDKSANISGQAEIDVFEIEITPGDQTGNSYPSLFPAPSISGQIEIMPKDQFPGKKATGGDWKDRSLRIGPDGSDLACSTASLPSEEFFDAPDAPFDDSTSDDETFLSNSTTRSPIKFGQTMKLKLQTEVAMRVQAEKALAALQQQWNEMARRYSPLGLSLLTGPCHVGASEDCQAADPSEFLSEKLSIARLVAGAIASASVRAVKEEELESFVIAKNREISRLRDKLQYYELVNHEMSQRNQEAIEISQRRRRRHRKRLKWALGSLGAIVGIGSTGLLCYKFIPWDRVRNVQSL